MWKGLHKHIETSAGYRFDEREYMEFPGTQVVMIYRVRNGFLMELVLKYYWK